MNSTPLEEAYKIHHIQSQTYGGAVNYNPSCIFCSSTQSIALMQQQDGGSYRRCLQCKKHFKATILNNAITNYSYSTYHLKGTN